MMIVAYEILQQFFPINCFAAGLCTAVQILLTFLATRTVVQLADQPTGRSRGASEDDRAERAWIQQQIDDDTGLNADDAWRIADDRKSWKTLRPVAGQAVQ